MVNKYLEKIAKNSEDKKSGFKPLHAVGASIAGSVVAAPLALGAHFSGKSLLDSKDTKGVSNMGTVKKMMRDHKLDVSFNHRNHSIKKNFSNAKQGMNHTIDAVNHGAAGPAFVNAKDFGAKTNFVGGVKDNPYFSQGRKKVIKNTDIIMHELGHAKDYQKLGKAKIIARTLGIRAAPLAALGALSHEKTRDYAVPISALGVLPTLRDEGAANYHAHKAIKAHKGAAAGKSFLKRTAGKNMAHYGLNAAAVVGSTYAAKKILDHYHPKKDK